MSASSLLGGRSPAEFLSRHWQKRPALIRGALPGFIDLVARDVLVQLACEPDVESRLVRVRGGRRPYHSIDGPQRAETLQRLPKRDWTLLVQRVDHHVPAVADLLDRFDFVPRWRLDDVMVSLAAPGGGVGPHVDNYDVFLIQGGGRRRWQLERRPDRTLRTGVDLQVLRRFEPDATWILGPGDMLYVPPGVAHHGVALEESLTYSVGFRAPSHRALAGAYAVRLLQAVSDADLYRDPDLVPPEHLGEVSASTLAELGGIVREEARRGLGRDIRAAVVGALTAGGFSVPRRVALGPTELRGRLAEGATLARAATARAAFVRTRNACWLFVNGREWRLPPGLARLAAALTGSRRAPTADVRAAVASAEGARVVVELVNEGAYVLEPRRDRAPRR